MLEVAVRLAFDLFAVSFFSLLASAAFTGIGLIGWMVVSAFTHRDEND
jgi:hypothetical protein